MKISILRFFRPSERESFEAAEPVAKESISDFSMLDLFEEEFCVPVLYELHGSLELSLRDEAMKLLVECIHGLDCDRLLTLDEARKCIDQWLDVNGLDIHQTSSNLLSENRREPVSGYAIESGKRKGNRHIYGKLPFISGAKKTIFEKVLHIWLEDNVRPHASPIKEVGE